MATMRGKENPTVPAPQDKDWFPQADWLAMHEDLKATSAKQGKVRLSSRQTERALPSGSGPAFPGGRQLAPRRTTQYP